MLKVIWLIRLPDAIQFHCIPNYQYPNIHYAFLLRRLVYVFKGALVIPIHTAYTMRIEIATNNSASAWKRSRHEFELANWCLDLTHNMASSSIEKSSNLFHTLDVCILLYLNCSARSHQHIRRLNIICICIYIALDLYAIQFAKGGICIRFVTEYFPLNFQVNHVIRYLLKL